MDADRYFLPGAGVAEISWTPFTQDERGLDRTDAEPVRLIVRRTPPTEALARNRCHDTLFPVFDYHLGLGHVMTKKIRRRIYSVNGRLVRTGRRVILRLPRRWPWASQITAALERLRALPAASG